MLKMWWNVLCSRLRVGRKKGFLSRESTENSATLPEKRRVQVSATSSQNSTKDTTKKERVKKNSEKTGVESRSPNLSKSRANGSHHGDAGQEVGEGTVIDKNIYTKIEGVHPEELKEILERTKHRSWTRWSKRSTQARGAKENRKIEKNFRRKEFQPSNRCLVVQTKCWNHRCGASARRDSPTHASTRQDSPWK